MAATGFFLLAILFAVAFVIVYLKKSSGFSASDFEDKKSSDKKEKLKSK
jgi:hypothetical protein